MKILLTNDDGIHAPGLEALEQVLRRFGEVTVVAPDAHLSGCSHCTTTDRPLSANQVGERRFAVDGTPADCVRLGLLALVPDVDWVVSGINDGGNLGIDILMSGTVAAAREATLLGRKATAISHYRKGRNPVDWGRASDLTHRILETLSDGQPPTVGYWNVNLPDVDPQNGQPDIVHCEPDTNPLPVQFVQEDRGYRYCGDYHARPRDAGTDVAVCFGGQIAVSYVKLAIR